MSKFKALVSRFIQNYIHTLWTFTIKKIQVSKLGLFYIFWWIRIQNQISQIEMWQSLSLEHNPSTHQKGWGKYGKLYLMEEGNNRIDINTGKVSLHHWVHKVGWKHHIVWQSVETTAGPQQHILTWTTLQIHHWVFSKMFSYFTNIEYHINGRLYK